jgi:hypothetical protein
MEMSKFVNTISWFRSKGILSNSKPRQPSVKQMERAFKRYQKLMKDTATDLRVYSIR